MEREAETETERGSKKERTYYEGIIKNDEDDG